MRIVLVIVSCLVLVACKKQETVQEPLEYKVNEDLTSYQEVSSISLGGAGAAEITAYDAITRQLFAVNNGSVNKIDIIDVSNPATAARVIRW